MNTITADLLPLAVDITTLNVWEQNPRRGDVEAVRKSYEQFGQRKPIVVRRGDRVVIAGNHQLLAARELGWDSIAVVWVDDDDATANAYGLADNRTGDLGSYDEKLLASLIASIADDSVLFAASGYMDADLAALLATETFEAVHPKPGSLSERFGVPPFSVLSARGGEWKERKHAWLSIGIESELGRAGDLLMVSAPAKYMNYYPLKNKAETAAGRELSKEEFLISHGHLLKAPANGTSVFDPVLAEVLYRWFSPAGGKVIDPWAGGSVRGIVAAVSGRDYIGIDLSAAQIEANQNQANLIGVAVSSGLANATKPQTVPTGTPQWIHGDSATHLALLPPEEFDMAIGCPPYYDLEVYSNDPQDLSTMSRREFDAEMAKTMIALSATLKPDSFAAFVVGGVRDKNGHILDMRRCMTNAAEAAGMHLYNDAIFLTPIGNAPIRAARIFSSSRAVARVHQEILIYVKGNRKVATQKLDQVTTETDLTSYQDADETEEEI